MGLYINHAAPQAAVAAGMLPTLPGQECEFKPISPALSSATALDNLVKKGATLTDIPFAYYKAQTYAGVNRRLDNSDFLKGKEPVFGSLPVAMDVYRDVAALVREMLAKWGPRESTDLIASMEMQDAPKVTVQQHKPTGWHLQSPVAEQPIPPMTDMHRQVFRRLAIHYASRIPADLKQEDWLRTILRDSDPPDTMTGSPTFTSGERTHLGRLAALAALPSPSGITPDEFILRMDALGHRLGLPEAAIYSPCLSTRTGPFKKMTPLWTQTPGGYQASWEGKGVYCRTRFVFPAPYHADRKSVV